VPIPTTFAGTFEGLGNAVSELSINDATDTNVGLFAEIANGATLRDVSVTAANIVATAENSCAAPLVGGNEGSIVGAVASGSAESSSFCAGGVVGIMSGSVALSSASTNVQAPDAGGLVGHSANGNITQSYATGKVVGIQSAGGLAGDDNGSTITNTYSRGEARAPKSNQAEVGGFEGGAFGNSIESSYSAGVVKGGIPGTRGGFVGYSEDSFGSDYWDTDTSRFKNIHRGAGNVKNEPGIEGLKTNQLRSGLPSGFDPTIWGENKKINAGLPYLLANPPR
jgi:hypothetical protein